MRDWRPLPLAPLCKLRRVGWSVVGSHPAYYSESSTPDRQLSPPHIEAAADGDGGWEHYQWVEVVGIAVVLKTVENSCLAYVV